jgi:hypothetical protein
VTKRKKFSNNLVIRLRRAVSMIRLKKSNSDEEVDNSEEEANEEQG